MTIRVVLTPIIDDDGDEHALAAALDTARRFGGHVRVMHVRAQPSAAVFAGAPEGAMVTAEILTLWEQDAKERATRARARYDRWRAAANVAEAAAPPARGDVSTSWVEIEGQLDPVVGQQGRLADLIVLGAPADRERDGAFYPYEGALFDSGRPVLLVPGAAGGAMFDNILVAWNGSAESASAVAGALPFLGRAKQVHVFSAGERGEDGTVPKDLLAYLGWHGIAATPRTIKAASHNVGAELLGEAERLGVGMVVMGAYTHSRTRQLIFGGATSHVLRHAKIPLLMAH
jgi:nucleotide-binding universal stress UspA family protein